MKKSYLIALILYISIGVLFHFNKTYSFKHKDYTGWDYQIDKRDMERKQFNIYFENIDPNRKIQVLDTLEVKYFAYFKYWVTYLYFAILLIAVVPSVLRWYGKRFRVYGKNN